MQIPTAPATNIGRSRRRDALVLAAFLLLSSGAACRSERPTETPPDEPPKASAAVGAQETETPQAVPDEVKGALEEIRKRGSCNKVMGCKPAEVLEHAGTVAIAPIEELLRRTGGDGQYRARLVRVLGRIGDPAAAPFLRELLGDGQWLIRVEAAIALGRVGDRSAVPSLEERITASRSTGGAAERAAAAYALVKLGEGAYRSDLAATLTPEAVRAQNWGFTTTAVELAAELGMSETLPGVRLAARHADVFLRKAALTALGRLGDKSSAGLLVDALDDPIPSARRTAEEALRMVTGQKLKGPEAWRAWCERTSCRGAEL